MLASMLPGSDNRRATRGGDSGKYGFMASDDVMERVRALRQQGYSPKEIARALRMPPAAVAPLVRAIAAEAGADSPASAPALAASWVNSEGASGLPVTAHPPSPA